MLQYLTHGATPVVSKVNEIIDQLNRLSSPLGSAGVQLNQTLLGRGLAVSPAQLNPRWPKLGFGGSTGVTPIAWYLFNHNAKDASGNDRDGTFGGDMNADKDVAQFDGSDDYVDCGADFLGTGAISISFWHNPLCAGGEYIFDNGQFQVKIAASPFAEITVSSDGGTTVASATLSFTNKEWQHFAITRAADGKVSTWLNDVLKIDDVSSGTPGDPGSNHLRIGSSLGGASFYEGLMHDVRIYGEVITEEKRLELYEVGNKRYLWGDNIIKTATLFRVNDVATGDGVYNCHPCLIDASDWADTDGADRFANYGSTVEVLNLLEGYVESDYTRGLARYDKMYAWLALDDEGNMRWVGYPLVPSPRMFRTTEAATANDHITCNAITYSGGEAGSLDILYNVEVYAKICNGTALNAAAPRLASGDYLFAHHERGKWWCTTVFDTDTEDCDCYTAP